MAQHLLPFSKGFMDKKPTEQNKQDPKEEQQQDDGFEVALNPDPRANENVGQNHKEDPDSRTKGVGTEITDGEAG
jgi:hypothetical protein